MLYDMTSLPMNVLCTCKCCVKLQSEIYDIRPKDVYQIFIEYVLVWTVLIIHTLMNTH